MRARGRGRAPDLGRSVNRNLFHAKRLRRELFPLRLLLQSI
jgi:hypothetical protein